MFTRQFAIALLLTVSLFPNLHADGTKDLRTRQHAWQEDIDSTNRTLKESPTSYLNIQDKVTLKTGESAYVNLSAPRAKVHWSRSRLGAGALRVQALSKRLLIQPADAAAFELPPHQSWAGPEGYFFDFYASTAEADVYLHDLQHPAFRSFKGLSYFPYDPAAVVKARFEKIPPEPVDFPTSTQEVRKGFFRVGRLRFTLENAAQTLDAFAYSENGDLSKKSFVTSPFHDKTNGHETYAGGRYLDVEMPNGLETSDVELDFNGAFNARCARTRFSSCILVVGNKLAVAVRAGEKAPPAH